MRIPKLLDKEITIICKSVKTYICVLESAIGRAETRTRRERRAMRIVKKRLQHARRLFRKLSNAANYRQWTAAVNKAGRRVLPAVSTQIPMPKVKPPRIRADLDKDK